VMAYSFGLLQIAAAADHTIHDDGAVVVKS
jgi:hypothetical protein